MSQVFYGEKLRLARQFHGLSLAELGDRVGISRQFIQQLEAEAKSPAIETEEALAAALSVEVSFFRRRLNNPVKIDQTHFRKLQSTSLSIVHQVLAHGTMLEQFLSYLESRLDLPEVRFPEYQFGSDRDIEDAATQCRLFWGIDKNAPIQNMSRVLETAGCVVVVFDYISNKVDALSMNRARPIIIRNTAKESLCRQRFDLAHECGHLVMHQGISTGDPETEAQANRFAAAFLLPREPFMEEFPRTARFDWRSIYKMKLKWKVSVQAIIKRAFELGLLDAAQLQKGHIQLRRNGQAKSEKFDDALPLEQPETLQMCFNVLQENKRLYISGMAADLDIRMVFFKRLISFISLATSEGEDSAAPVATDVNVIRFSR